MSRQPIKKILVRSPNWVGDAVMATPVPAALKQSLPGCEVHVLARDWVAPLWEQHPLVDRIVSLQAGEERSLFSSWRAGWRLRGERYDSALILPDSFSSAWLAAWAGIPMRIGYPCQQRGWLLTCAVRRESGHKFWPRPKKYLHLACAVGADIHPEQPWKFVVNVTQAELEQARSLLGGSQRQVRIGLAPGSVAPSRRWPVARFAQLADWFLKSGSQVVLAGSRSDEVVAAAVAREMQRSGAVVTAGKTNLRQGLAVIRSLDLLVSNDSGAMHMAYAQGVPVLVLQGAADARVTGPFGDASRIIRDERIGCSPCVRNDCPLDSLKCMEAISVDQVWEAAQDMLKSTAKS